jgi:Bacterial PH domain
MVATATRVNKELTAAGMTRYGHLKLASRYLYHLIRPDEHILSVIYGRYSGGEGELVATNERILFVDKKPLFVKTEDVPYNTISGILHSAGGLFASITLQTRLGDFKLVYVNKNAANHFVQLIEGRLERQEKQRWLSTF